MAVHVAGTIPSGRSAVSRRLTRRTIVGGLAATGTLSGSLSSRAEPDDVDLLLVLAADISRSVDERKFRLQRQGYAAALTHPRVIKAIGSGEHGRIGLCFVEWSGPSAQIVILDWTAIASAEDAARVARTVLDTPRTFMERTAIGAAVEYSVTQLARAPFKATRKVIDVSGDGTNTNGLDPGSARETAKAADVIINGIVILSETPLPQNPMHTHPPGGLLKYYEDNVIVGPGSFALPAEGFEAFGDSLISKLVKEISESPEAGVPTVSKA